MAEPDKKGGVWNLMAWQETLPEANIQGEFYHCCRLLDIDCVLEFTTGCGRHDVLILDDYALNITAIVECKADRTMRLSGRQQYRYALLGVPLFMLWDVTEAWPLAQKIKATKFTQFVDLDKSRDLFRVRKRKRIPRARRYDNHPMNFDEYINYKEQ